MGRSMTVEESNTIKICQYGGIEEMAIKQKNKKQYYKNQIQDRESYGSILVIDTFVSQKAELIISIWFLEFDKTSWD